MTVMAPIYRALGGPWLMAAEIEETTTPDRIILGATRCGNTRTVDDRDGFPIEQPCDWEGIEEFAVFDSSEEVIGVCPECEQEIYLKWESV